MLHLEPGWRSLLHRGILKGLRTLRRDRQWSGNLGALLGTFVLVQMLVIGLTCMAVASEQLGERTELQLELLGSASDASISDLMNTLQNLPYVAKVTFMTREQAYDRARKTDPDLIGFLEQYGIRNPFHDAVNVTLTSLAQYRSLLGILQDEQWQRIIDPSFLSDANAEQAYMTGLLKLTLGLRSLTLFVLGCSILTLLFIVMNLTRSRALVRSQEVLVERLAGAQSATILIPFVAEASVLLIASALGSALLVISMVTVAPFFVTALQPSGIFHALWSSTQSMLLIAIPTALATEILVAPLLGWIGTWMGIGQQIRNPRIAMNV